MAGMKVRPWLSTTHRWILLSQGWVSALNRVLFMMHARIEEMDWWMEVSFTIMRALPSFLVVNKSWAKRKSSRCTIFLFYLPNLTKDHGQNIRFCIQVDEYTVRSSVIKEEYTEFSHCSSALKGLSRGGPGRGLENPEVDEELLYSLWLWDFPGGYRRKDVWRPLMVLIMS